jgi:hypothetical protein
MLLRLIKILGDRNAGFILCLMVILNLAIGSLVMNLYPDLYPPFFPFDLNFFFDPVAKVHFWLYGLLVTFGLFTVNLSACLIESILRLIQSPQNRLRQSAALLFHIALFLTLAAHLYDGFYGSSGQAMITPEGTLIPGIGHTKVLSINNSYHPDGKLKDTEANLLFRLHDGSEVVKKLTYNQPAIFDGGTREVIIQSGDKQPIGVVLTNTKDHNTFAFHPYEPVAIPGGTLRLQGLFQTEMGMIFAQFQWAATAGRSQTQVIALDQGLQQHSSLMLAGNRYQFQEMIEEPYLAAMVRYNPAIPLILLSLLTASLGTLLLIQVARNGKVQKAPA